jgi:glycosyltransferase involved in cell wall biosynthesis
MSGTRAAVDWARFLDPEPTGASDRPVYVHAHSAAFQAPGGGEVQLVRTASELARLGVPVRPFDPWADRLAEGRLLHLFGMSHEGLELARVAKRKGLPVVLSPICWFEPRALWALAPNHAVGAAHLAIWGARRLIPGLPGWRRELLGLADVILPNSVAEGRQLHALFGAAESKIQTVPNGVDSRLESADGDRFRERFGDEPFVLYAGRIEPRKNVLGLIRALRSAGLPLRVLGGRVPGQEGYAEHCRREGEGFVAWQGRLRPDDPMLGATMAAARVLALPSWFETPGLVALEAALLGCSIAITPYGCTRDYFGDHAEYAEPGSGRAIRRAVGAAWDRPPSTELAQMVRERYLWAHVAQRTAEVYDQVAP